MTDDELTGVFDHLEPSDFITKTTAEQESTPQPEPNWEGEEAFNQFTNEMVRSMMTWYVPGKPFYPKAVLRNRYTERIFKPTEEESVRDYLTRLHQESRLMSAKWTFIAMFVESTTYVVDETDESRPINDPEIIAAKQAEGLMTPSLVYYAERRENSTIERRNGVIYLDKQGRFLRSPDGESVVGFWDSDQDSPFRWIFDGVPQE